MSVGTGLFSAAAVMALPSLMGCQSPAPAARGTPTRAPIDQDRYRRPDLLVAALHLAPGAAVADVGAGGGYLTHRLAAQVGPGGRVTATDIQAAQLARIGAGGPGEAPITTRLVSPDEPGLEPAAYDLILLSEVDHLLADRAGYLRKLVPSLRAGGRIAISNRRVHRAALLAALERARLSPVAEYQGLPTHFLIEVKP
jgi:2-polyprenyl-3-methyl-5-hydroxy-6-metoxy-1,4-benzoquinol methylase